tara:strand:+ start:756 stop:1025 length:270 start_codon:yes stop_codon:yes gene_type:complete
MARIKLSAAEVSLAAGIGNSTTVSNARVVRFHNDSGAAAVLYVTDSNYAGIGSISIKDGTTELIEKHPEDYIYYTGSATVKIARVGITN